MSEEQAAQVDDNMPPVDQETEQVETEQLEAVSETTEESATSTTGEFVDTDNDKIQARFNTLTAEKYAEKNRADQLAQELEQLKSQASQVTTQPEATGRPTIEQFDYDQDAYQQALVKFETNQAITELQNRQQQEAAQLKQQQVQQAFNEKVAKFTTEAPDYADVVTTMYNM